MNTCYVGVPPGLGDIYWTLTKLESKRRLEGIDKLTLVIYSKNTSDTSGAMNRCAGIHQLLDFVDDSFYASYDKSKNGMQKVKMLDGSVIPVDVMWANEHLEAGNHISTWMPQYATAYGFRLGHAVYPNTGFVVYPSSRAINKAWTEATPAWWAELIIDLSDHGTPTIIGAHWDVAMWESIKEVLRVRKREHCYIDMVGKTTLREVLGIIKSANVVIGAISGMTIAANHYGIKTVALCPGKFHDLFPSSWLKPGFDNSLYRVVRCPPPPPASTIVKQLV